MATDQRNLPAFLADDATFRTWGSGIAAQLAVVGLMQASDTGQINWTTVTRPGTANTNAGYEVWRFADALQATRPVFIKITYGVSNPIDRPQMLVVISTATNGAGTSSGQVGPTLQLYPSASKTTGTTLPSYCSGSSGELTLCTNLDAASSNYSSTLCVGRTRTGAGVSTGDGIAVFAGSSGGTGGSFQVIPFSGGIPTAGSRNMAASLSAAGISSVGPNVALSPTIAPLGKAYFASWAAYLHADLGELGAFTVDHLGATRTMMPLGDGLYSAGAVQGTATGHSLAILWE